MLGSIVVLCRVLQMSYPSDIIHDHLMCSSYRKKSLSNYRENHVDSGSVKLCFVLLRFLV